jgi:hypothetical protein
VTLEVSCGVDGGGWRCRVSVGDDPAATVHEVTLDQATLDDLGPGSSPEELVRRSFEFLLEREPRESIMRDFDLPLIGRFFPEYPVEIRRRLGG